MTGQSSMCGLCVRPKTLQMTGLFFSVLLPSLLTTISRIIDEPVSSLNHVPDVAHLLLTQVCKLASSSQLVISVSSYPNMVLREECPLNGMRVRVGERQLRHSWCKLVGDVLAANSVLLVPVDHADDAVEARLGVHPAGALETGVRTTSYALPKGFVSGSMARGRLSSTSVPMLPASYESISGSMRMAIMCWWFCARTPSCTRCRRGSSCRSRWRRR